MDEQTIIGLKENIDTLVQKGSELSKDLSIDERYNVMKRVLLEGVDKALLNTETDGKSCLSKKEVSQRKDNLKDFVLEYFEEKFSERIAMEWDEN